VHVRPATAADLDSVFVLLDAAVAWLAANGREDQWGTRPWSQNPAAVERVRGRIAAGRLHVAETEDGHELLGVIAYEPETPAPIAKLLGISDPAEPQIYITNFVGSRSPRGRGVGGLLLDHARAAARARGIRLLRLDCYAGGDGALARYYERAGYRPVGDFPALDDDGRTSPGRLFELRLDDEA
jgi:GNAT superfamily N-acetyltransferase